jgi:hypothetical protein
LHTGPPSQQVKRQDPRLEPVFPFAIFQKNKTGSQNLFT